MIRALYRCLVYLHPAAFRKEFGPAMIWIFDEARASEGARPLFFDAGASLLRQWLLRPGIWKLLAAASGGFLQVALGGFGWPLARLHTYALHSAPGRGAAGDPGATAQLAEIAGLAVAFIISATLVLVWWSASVMRSRTRRD